MSDVNNEIQLQATQAITELNRLAAATDAANASLTKFKITGDGELAPSLNTVGKKAETMGQKVFGAFKKIGKGAADATTKTRGLGLSLGDVARIVQSQIIFGAISNIKNGFFEAADAAAAFQLQIARIESIEPDFTGDFRDEVEKLAETLGRPISEVGEAAYEALQNDLGDVTKTMKILKEEANDLARVTGGTLPQAVNALSSIYKSFEGTNEDLNNVAGQLFGTINAGRISMKDLENSLGTIAPLGREAGAGLQDILDAMATISLTGTKASVATTQLRNVFNKLIKPTDELRKVFDLLGVKGFKELDKKMGGLVPALQEITKAVGNDEQKIAKLFNTIRGNLGVLNTLTNNGILFAETAERSGLAAERLGEAIENINATQAVVAAKQAAKLEVIFTRLGDDALLAKNKIAGLFLEVIEDAREAEIVMGTFAIGMTVSTVAVKVFGVTAKKAFLPLTAIAGSITLGFTLSEAFLAAAKAAAELKDENAKFDIGSLKEVVKTIQEINADGITEFNDEFSETSSLFRTTLKEARATAKGITDAFAETKDVLSGATQSLLERFADGRKRIIDQIGQAIEDIDKDIQDGTKRIANLTDDLHDFTFERGLKDMNQAQQVTERMERSAEATRHAFELAANAGIGEESQSAARAAAKTAVAQAKSALSAADRLGNAIQIQKAEAAMQTAITSQLAVERQLVGIRENVSLKQLEKQQQLAKKTNSEQQESLKVAADARKAIEDAIKKGADESVVAGLEDSYQTAMKKALTGLDKFSSNELVKTFGFDKASDILNARLRQGMEGLDLDWKRLTDGLQAEIKAADFSAAVELTASINEKALSFELKRAISQATAGGGLPDQELADTVKAVEAVGKKRLETQGKIEESSAKVKANAREATAFFEQAAQFEFEAEFEDAQLAQNITKPAIESLKTIGSQSREELVKTQKGFILGLETVQAQATGLFGTIGTTTKEELIRGLTSGLQAVSEQLGIELIKPEALAETQGILALVNEIQTEEVPVIDVNVEKLQGATKEIGKTRDNAEDASVATASIGTSADGAIGFVALLSSTTGELGGAADQAAEAFKRMEMAAKSANDEAAKAPNSSNSGGSDGFNAVGGQVSFRAGGGTTEGRGRDTQMVGLQSGEHVSNVGATKNFLPELQAINAGNFVGGSAGGGGDTNITIGDINVTSNGQVGSNTGRDIGHSLKREIRRGNLRL
jgi:TP901 family phage tail tape measure protein